MSQFVLTFTPNHWAERGKPFILEEKEWREAVQLVERRGYRPNTFSGLDRASVKPFAQELRLALGQQPDKLASPGLMGLHSFLVKEGREGFSLSRGYRKWNQ